MAIEPSPRDTNTALGVALLALLLGALGDVLLRATPWGINLILWLLALSASMALIALVSDRALRVGIVWQLALLLPLALLFVWRDAGTLKAINLLALLVALAAPALRVSAPGLRRICVLDAGLAAVAMGVHTAFGAPILFARELPWRRLGLDRYQHVAPATTRGILLAVPLVLLFGGLFASADAAFAGLAAKLIHPNLATVFQHLIFTALVAWLAAGFLRGRFLAGTVEYAGLPRQSLAVGAPAGGTNVDAETVASVERIRAGLGLGGIETGIVLGLLDALFLSFVAVQFRYFFGGAALVEASSTLTYAEYARRGFFELVTVATLVLPLLLTLDWLLRSDAPRSGALFRALAGVLLALVVVVMVSALQRMRLYQAEYGLTELRLYTTAFMGWLGLVLVWFSATVLRGRRELFGFGAAVTALGVVLALNVLNPSAFIVRANLARSRSGHSLDVAYADSLGADAVPGLVTAAPLLPVGERCMLSGDLLRTWGSSPGDWRTWTLAQQQARAAVHAHAGSLLDAPCRTPAPVRR
jgi:hypothetical protein